MGNQIKGAIISFDKDYHEADAENIARAIRMIKGVADVTFSVADTDDWMNRSRIKREIHQDLYDVVNKKDKQ